MVEEQKVRGQDAGEGALMNPEELQAKMMNQLMSLQAMMGHCTVENLKAITQAKKDKALSLREELTAQADQVISIVNDMRAKLEANCMGE